MLLAVIAGCDTAPGPEPLDRRPPVLSDFAYAPREVDLGTLPPEQIVGGEVQVPITFSVVAQDPDGPVAEVTYLIKAPLEVDRALEVGTMAAVGEGRYEATTTLRVPVGEIGDYALIVYAVDADAQLSNQVRGTVALFSSGEAPVIEGVEAIPDTLRPPGELVLIATVSDPDGLENIAQVVGRAPAGFVFQMFDDGQSQGDAAAGDGRFTARFDVPSATPGVQTFSFQATDRSGLKSAVVTKDVVIE
ncbi:MAG: hypothetical protein D6685_05470 [Bacteroidetes bacterium]|nr:MAG: hypothetical protein D6685_05470 [Bacteroidota bacterium]